MKTMSFKIDNRNIYIIPITKIHVLKRKGKEISLLIKGARRAISLIRKYIR